MNKSPLFNVLNIFSLFRVFKVDVFWSGSTEGFDKLAIAIYKSIKENKFGSGE